MLVTKNQPDDGCPDNWDYEDFPNYGSILREALKGILRALRAGMLDTSATSKNTRSVHRRLFATLTPPAHDYFAGHYRGEPFRCLQTYRVGVPDDAGVGAPPARVAAFMHVLSEVIDQGLSSLDAAREAVGLSEADKLANIVTFACMVFQRLLTIHPYANGNGHAARFVIWAILMRYGHIPRRWPIEPRPPHPGYAAAIKMHRYGDPLALEQLVLGAI